MRALLNPILVLVVIAMAVVAVAVVTACQMHSGSGRSRVGIAISILPSFVLVGLFYSLAIHMYQSLGGWPKVIGEHGFPPLLIEHSDVALTFFGDLLLTTLFGWPGLYLLCLLIPKWRKLAPYLGTYMLSFVVGIGIMLLAPSPFLNWWWD